MARKAWFKKSSSVVGTAYRSGLEGKIANQLEALEVSAGFESHFLNYTKPETKHRYTPDFILPNGIIIESKGLFDSDDRKKHLLIKEQIPQLDIRFVFSRSASKLYKGSKTSYADWCVANGFEYADKLVPVEWIKESNKHIPDGLLFPKK